MQRIVDDPLSTCPECKEEELKKVIVASGGFQLKGKGWFKSGGY
jgi:putative FmdB family regulatory protein|tara:strand:- start:2224 stop:2355 length:132 start_codon:yes stop_codon:yes gene_type:complete